MGVNTVALFLSANAICFAVPLTAGPVGFVPFAGASPGAIEIRVVLGVQSFVPRQVSRTKTCRNPLFGMACPFAFAPVPAFPVALCVTATNATNLPDALIEGKIPSVPFNAPFGSVEINIVAGLQAFPAPMQVSRK